MRNEVGCGGVGGKGAVYLKLEMLVPINASECHFTPLRRSEILQPHAGPATCEIDV